MIPFHPFPKIAESTTEWGGDETLARARSTITWVATEKLHGANLCLCTDGDEIRVAKRRTLLDGEDFFGYRDAVGPLLPALRSLHNIVSAKTGTPWLFVYGELFGGSYPHPDVAAVDGVEPVQTGVYYCPDIRFAAFDVAVVNGQSERSFLPYRDTATMCRTAGMPIVPEVARGMLPELLALPVEFPTRVPSALGLPPLQNNLAEGMVIRPWDREVALPGRYARLLIKRKNSRFAERRYHGARAWAAPPSRDALAQAERAALDLVTRNRVNDAISKTGRPDGSSERQEEIGAEVARDVRETLEESHGALLLSLPVDEQRLLWSVVEDAVADMLESAARGLDPQRYHVQLAYAFVRGALGADAAPARLVELAREAGLSLHKFKRKHGPPRVTRVLSLLRELAPRRLLDIGTGRGAFLWPLLARFPDLEVVSIDRAIARVKDVEAVRAGGIQRVRGLPADVAALPFRTDSFDVVTMLEVLEHVADPAAAAAEALRVARGFVVVSVPSHADDNPEHIRVFEEGSLGELFRDAGCRRVSVDRVRGHMIALVSVPPERAPDGADTGK